MPSLRSRAALQPFLLVLTAATLLACGEEKSQVDDAWPPPPSQRGMAPQGPTSTPARAPQAAPPATSSPRSPARQDAFSGRFAVRYEGADYTLELQTLDGQRYQGAVSLAGRRYPISGARQGAQLVGRFADPDGSEYGYVGRAQGSGLVFVLEDGETIPFQRMGGAPAAVGSSGGQVRPPEPRAPTAWPPPPPPLPR